MRHVTLLSLKGLQHIIEPIDGQLCFHRIDLQNAVSFRKSILATHRPSLTAMISDKLSILSVPRTGSTAETVVNCRDACLTVVPNGRLFWWIRLDNRRWPLKGKGCADWVKPAAPSKQKPWRLSLTGN